MRFFFFKGAPTAGNHCEWLRMPLKTAAIVAGDHIATLDHWNNAKIYDRWEHDWESGCYKRYDPHSLVSLMMTSFLVSHGSNPSLTLSPAGPPQFHCYGGRCHRLVGVSRLPGAIR
jgi:hypothetical protein